MKDGGLRTKDMENNALSSMLISTLTQETTSMEDPMARAFTDGQKMNTIKASGRTATGMVEADIRKEALFM